MTAAKEVYVDGFRFRHNKGTDGKGAKHLALDGTVAAAYGANVTVKDGAAQDNAAEISGGTVTGNAYGGALTAVAATKNAAGGSAHMGTQGVTMRYQFALQKRGTDELVLTLIGAAMNDQTKSLVEPRCGATDFINRGADLLAASGISSAAKEGGRAEDDEKRGYQLWAAMSQGTMRAETGSYVTTNGYNLSVGWAKEGRLRAAKTLFTPFVEYGRGTYHTYLDDGTHGNGKISYLGAGLMGASNARTDAGRRRRCTAEEYEAAIAVMSLSGRSRPTTAKMPTMRRISASERRGCSARVIH